MQAKTISPDILAHDYTNMIGAALKPAQLAANIKSLAAATSYPANGSIASIVFWTQVSCDVTGGKSFLGKAWGIGTPGGGALIGDVYTDDINKLYADTTDFIVTPLPVYTAIYFKDKNGSLLGHFQAGSVSTVAGTFGGSGKWT
jgi:hypothetical protein